MAATLRDNQDALPHYDVLRRVCECFVEASDKKTLRSTARDLLLATTDTVDTLAPAEPRLDQVKKRCARAAAHQLPPGAAPLHAAAELLFAPLRPAASRACGTSAWSAARS
jgi:hypothetical protein